MPALICNELCWTQQLNEKSNENFLNSSTLLRTLLCSTRKLSRDEQSIKCAAPFNLIDSKFEFDKRLNENSQQETKELSSRIPFENFRRIGAWNWLPQKSKQHVHVESKSVAIHPHCKCACFETFAAIGDRPLKKGALTYWEIRILNNNNNQLSQATSVMIGLGNRQARLNTIGYLNLIGIDQNSLGLSNSGHVWFNSQPILHVSSNPFLNGDESNAASSPAAFVVIGCMYDGYRHQLTFYKNGKRLNLATSIDLSDLNGDLYPMVSSTMSNTQFKLELIFESQQSLQELCKSQIRKCLISSKITSEEKAIDEELLATQSLNLPKSLVYFLNQ